MFQTELNLYMRKITSTDIQDGAGSVRQRYTSLFGPSGVTRFLSGTTIIWSRNVRIHFVDRIFEWVWA